MDPNAWEVARRKNEAIRERNRAVSNARFASLSLTLALAGIEKCFLEKKKNVEKRRRFSLPLAEIAETWRRKKLEERKKIFLLLSLSRLLSFANGFEVVFFFVSFVSRALTSCVHLKYWKIYYLYRATSWDDFVLIIDNKFDKCFTRVWELHPALGLMVVETAMAIYRFKDKKQEDEEGRWFGWKLRFRVAEGHGDYATNNCSDFRDLSTLFRVWTYFSYLDMNVFDYFDRFYFVKN